MMNSNPGFQQTPIVNNQMGSSAINRPPPNQNVLDTNLSSQNQLPNIPGNDPSMVTTNS